MRIKVWEQLWMNERQNMKMAEIKIERIDEWQLIGSVFSRWDKNGRSNLCSYLQETLLKTMGRKVNPLKYFAEYKCYTNITCFVEIHSLCILTWNFVILLWIICANIVILTKIDPSDSFEKFQNLFRIDWFKKKNGVLSLFHQFKNHFFQLWPFTYFILTNWYWKAKSHTWHCACTPLARQFDVRSIVQVFKRYLVIYEAMSSP